MNHTSHVSYSQRVDRSTFLNLKHGQVRILRKPSTTVSNSEKATSSANIATALFGNTTSGGYHRYNPGNLDETGTVNTEPRSDQPPISNSLQAAEGRQSEAFANGQPQILKRAVHLEAEIPQQPSARRTVTPTSWTQARESRGYGNTQRGRGRRGYRGRGRGGRAVDGSLRNNQEPPNWRLSLCVNTPTGKQTQVDESSGWSISRIPVHQRTPRPPEGQEFLPGRPGFRKVVAWLDDLDENSTEGVDGGLDNEPYPESYAEELFAFSAFSDLSLDSRPPTPENCLNAGDPNTATRRRQARRAHRDQDDLEISDAEVVKSMEVVYEEAKRKMSFIEAEDQW
ncbi:hypothetical protein FGG08_004982 [Glutinoglossum americanum]|uniref:Uncharacterized protein n=1 Tax=Glutinoglossum americanum TaxID=1670608 RepID=A0A9P8I846_9PEZI|nr:hypothetical protein FGG08_004982 [Glutinoglossum americanum]